MLACYIEYIIFSVNLAKTCDLNVTRFHLGLYNGDGVKDLGYGLTVYRKLSQSDLPRFGRIRALFLRLLRIIITVSSMAPGDFELVYNDHRQGLQP